MFYYHFIHHSFHFVQAQSVRTPWAQPCGGASGYGSL